MKEFALSCASTERVRKTRNCLTACLEHSQDSQPINAPERPVLPRFQRSNQEQSPLGSWIYRLPWYDRWNPI